MGHKARGHPRSAGKGVLLPPPHAFFSLSSRGWETSLGFPSHFSLCLPASTHKKTKQNKTANAGTPKGLKKRSVGCCGHLRSCCQGLAPPHPLGVHREDPKEQHWDPVLPASQHSPTGFVLLAADAAAAEQREQEDEQQRQEGPCPDHPHPLVGLCKTGAGSAGSCPGVQPPAPTGTHPCGRRPSEGHTCHRGSCRLRHSWLRSGRAGR